MGSLYNYEVNTTLVCRCYALQLTITDWKTVDTFISVSIRFENCHTLTLKIKTKKIFKDPGKIMIMTELIKTRELDKNWSPMILFFFNKNPNIQMTLITIVWNREIRLWALQNTYVLYKQEEGKK